MEKLTAQEFELWSKGGIDNSDVFFVMIKTASCPKCVALENVIKKHEFDGIGIKAYVYQPSEKVAAAIMSNLEVMSVPTMIFRHKQEGWKLDKIDCSDHDDFTNEFEAIKTNDRLFFEDEPNKLSLLDLIYGEEDPEAKKNRELLKRAITK